MNERINPFTFYVTVCHNDQKCLKWLKILKPFFFFFKEIFIPLKSTYKYTKYATKYMSIVFWSFIVDRENITFDSAVKFLTFVIRLITEIVIAKDLISDLKEVPLLGISIIMFEHFYILQFFLVFFVLAFTSVGGVF